MIGYRVTVRWPAEGGLEDVRVELAAEDPAAAALLLGLLAEAVDREGALVIASPHPDPAAVWNRWQRWAPTGYPRRTNQQREAEGG